MARNSERTGSERPSAEQLELFYHESYGVLRELTDALFPGTFA